MTTRAMGPMAGIGWLTRAINVGRNGPGAVFGGAALMGLVVLVGAFAVGLMQVAMAAAMGGGTTTMMIGSALISVLFLVLLAVMMVGFLRLLDKVESGRPARAVDVFGGFGDPGVSLRTIGLMLLLTIAQYGVLGIILVTFAGGFLDWYMQTMQVSMGGGVPEMTELPAGMGIATFAMFVVGLVFFGVQAIALGQIVLRGRGVFSAFGDGVLGAFKNLLPLLVFFVAWIVAMALLIVAVVLVAMLIGLLGKLVGMWLAVVLAIPLYIGLMLALFAVVFGAMYHLWRDVCGGADTDAVPVRPEVFNA